MVIENYRIMIWVILFHSLLLAACATTPSEPSPFKVSREEIFAKVKTIAMTPLQGLKKMEREAQVSARYESLIKAELQRAGFKVIPSKEYKAIWEPHIKQVGGLYDPVTGEVDKEKLKAVSDLTLRELGTKYKVDAVLNPIIVVVRAPWYQNTATWDGVTEATTGKEGFWASMMAPSASGTIAALSLAAVLSDPNGGNYYAHRGGIQLAAQIQRGGLLKPGVQFALLPEQSLFLDPAKDERAVKIALSPLVEGPKANPEPTQSY